MRGFTNADRSLGGVWGRGTDVHQWPGPEADRRVRFGASVEAAMRQKLRLSLKLLAIAKPS